MNLKQEEVEQEEVEQGGLISPDAVDGRPGGITVSPENRIMISPDKDDSEEDEETIDERADELVLVHEETEEVPIRLNQNPEELGYSSPVAGNGSTERTTFESRQEMGTDIPGEESKKKPLEAVEDGEKNPAGEPEGQDTETWEEFFKCSCCWQLLFKPAILGCGHGFCTCCVLKALQTSKESRCPYCRQSYRKFPDYCSKVHRFIEVTFPAEFEKKKKHTLGTLEKELGQTSEDIYEAETDPRQLLKCQKCSNLVCLPVVLNCGHLFCEHCLADFPQKKKCHVCSRSHSRAMPSVYLVLKDYMEVNFPEIKDLMAAKAKEKWKAKGKEKVCDDSNSENENIPPEFLHRGVTCNGCGQCPIVGTRYSCRDCEEGRYNLCRSCKDSPPKYHRPFHHNHTLDHRFLIFDTAEGVFEDEETEDPLLYLAALFHDDVDVGDPLPIDDHEFLLLWEGGSNDHPPPPDDVNRLSWETALYEIDFSLQGSPNLDFWS